MVERNLAKVEVASSRLVSRSRIYLDSMPSMLLSNKKTGHSVSGFFSFYNMIDLGASPPPCSCGTGAKNPAI